LTQSIVPKVMKVSTGGKGCSGSSSGVSIITKIKDFIITGYNSCESIANEDVSSSGSSIITMK
jgi:hypothetical protein